MAIALATGVLWGGLPVAATEKAKQHARLAYRQLSEDAAVLYAMGMISFVSGESLDTTLGYLQDAAGLEPSNPMYQAILGYLLAHTGDTNAGLKRCHYAMRLSPRDSREPFLCYMLGSAHIAAREYAQAVQVMRRCARFSQVDFVWLMLAYAYERLGNRKELRASLAHVANGGRLSLMQWSMNNSLWLGHTQEEKAGLMVRLAELERPSAGQ
jgi:predicted Zn-dependent protease